MRTIYLQCNAGASGDMIVGALAGLLDDPQEFVSMIDSAGIPGLTLTLEKGEMSAITGNRVHFFIEGEEEGHGHHHHHTPVSDVLGLIKKLNVSDRVKNDACAIYGIIEEMHDDTNLPVEIARQGANVSFRVETKIRPSDKLFRIDKV